MEKQEERPKRKYTKSEKRIARDRAQREAWNDPATRDGLIARLVVPRRGVKRTEETKQRMSKGCKESWESGKRAPWGSKSGRR